MFQHVENAEKKPAPKVWEKQKKGKKKAVKTKKKTKQAFNWKASTVNLTKSKLPNLSLLSMWSNPLVTSLI
jgi:long-subunit acyl-CoA synthetase (AMP-forming)